MSEHGTERIHLLDLARSALKTLPQTPQVLRGLWNLATVKADSKLSIGLMIERHAARTPLATALVFEGRSWSYAAFNAWANRIAASLAAAGVKPGDSVAILMENRAETLACVAAVVKLGAAAGMLNHQQRGDVLTHSINLIAPRALIVGEECREALASTAFKPERDEALRFFWAGNKAAPKGYTDLAQDSEKRSEQNPPVTATIKAGATCFYVFTSGTTGLPKASRMTHYRWLRGMAGLSQMALRIKPEEVFYCCLPLYHNNALTVSWGAVLGSGCTLVLSKKFSATRFWDELRESKATAFCYIGELCRYLLNRPATPKDRIHDVRLMVGNGLRPELWVAFQQRFGIENVSEFYGASESNVAFVNAFGMQRTAGFCPLSFAIVAFDAELEQPLRDAKGFLQKVPKGGTGLLIAEISERAPFDGYTDQKSSDAKVLSNVFKKGDTWFNTGDLVRDQGWRHIQFVDRVGDTFRWKGENVATTEVESALNGFEGIEQAVVYGVNVVGADGRAGMAAVTLAGTLDGAALARHLSAVLPAYAVPLFLRLKAEQEMTGTFKFKKVDLKREGFDPAAVAEPLYVLADRSKGYEPLTPALFQKIHTGALRL
ncbi:MAG: long-chain-acyl-CoA synthetase [Pseudomonadota bacterium]